MMKTNSGPTDSRPTRRGIPTGHSGRNPKSSHAWLGLLGVASALALCPPSSLNAQTLLAGFYEAGADSPTAVTRAANYQANGITAEWFGATRATNFGSSDETYGSSSFAAPAHANTAGAYRANVANTLTITNNTGSNVSLESLVFDYHNNGNTTRDYWDIVTLTYVSGDLEVSDATIINIVSGLDRDTTGLAGTDYNDYFWNLKSLTDYTLANGESAIFSLIATFTDTAAGNPTNFAALDNIGFIGTISVVPEPTSALACLLLTAGLLRRRRHHA
jgi:hypothetical protein